MSGNFTVLTPEQEERVKKLEAFYEEVRKIAIETNLFKAYPVYEALSKVNPYWKDSN